VKRVRLGVVGCGIMGNRHLKTASGCPLIEIAATADVVRERAEASARQFGAPKAYANARKLIADPNVDAVVFATIAAQRDRLVIAALKAGKHVLVEKPIAMNARVVERMVEARGGRVAACCSARHRSYESADVARDFIASGGLGELRVIHCRVHEAATGTPEKAPPPWRLNRSMNGGGILMNWGCYDLDYLLGITGWKLKPALVLAQTWAVPPRMVPNVAPGSDAEPHFAALIRCEGGAVISFERGEYMPAHSQRAWQIVGTNGSLNLIMTPWAAKEITHDDTTTEKGLTTRTIWQIDGPETMRKDMVIDFAEAIVHGREPLTTLEKALLIQKVTDAIYKSARTGRAVKVN
jgi:predicted dehydrogenase